MVVALGHTQTGMIDLQGILVEKGFAIQRQTGDHAVVQGTLSGIAIAAIGCEHEHAASKKSQAKGGAGFGIGRAVGQMIGHGKGLTCRLGTNSAGDVHFLIIDVIKQTLCIGLQISIAQFQSQISNGAV